MNATPQSRPHRARRNRRLWKAALALATLGPMAAYLAHAAGVGELKIGEGQVLLSTGDYRWAWPLDQTRAFAWVLGLGLLIALGGLLRRGAARGAGRDAGPDADPNAGPNAGPNARRDRGEFSWGQFAGVAAAWTLTLGLALAQWQRVPRWEALPWGLWTGAASLAAWLTLRVRIGGRPALERLGAALARPAGAGTFLFFSALGGAAAAAAWRFIYHGHPLVTDAESQIAQARLMLSGAWRLEIPQALRDAISFPYGTRDVPSFSQYPPGHILLIMPFLAAGLPAQAWSIVAAGLTAGLAALLAGRIAGGAAARAAGLLVAGSPFFWALGGEAMNHITAAMLLVLAAWCWIPAGPARAPATRRALAALGGLALGWAVMTRPVTGLAHALVWAGAWAILWLDANRGTGVRRGDRTRRALGGQALWAAAGLLLPAAIFLFYNFKTTGHALEMGYQSSNAAMHRLGFRSTGPYPYTPAEAIDNLAADITSLNFLMFGWAAGSWTLLAIWWLRTRLGRAERILIALIAVQTLAYFLYHFHDLFLGPRFDFELLPAWTVLAAAGLSSTLRRGSKLAGAIWVILAVLSLAGAATGADYWRIKFADIVARHERLDAFIRAHEPVTRPTVFVVPAADAEIVGRYFPALRGEQPRWFVPEEQESAARALPELKDYTWIKYSPR